MWHAALAARKKTRRTPHPMHASLFRPLIVVLLTALLLVSCIAQGGQPATPPAGTQPVTAGPITGRSDGEAKQLNGAGATFPAPLYTKWFSEYQKITEVQVNYQPVGSGAG